MCRPRGAMDQRVGLLIQRLWVRVPPGVDFYFLFIFHLFFWSTIILFYERMVDFIGVSLESFGNATIGISREI